MTRSPVSDSTQVPGYSSDPNATGTLFNGIPMEDFAYLYQDTPEYGMPPAGPVKFLKLLSVVLLRFSGRIGVLDRRLGVGRIRWS